MITKSINKSTIFIGIYIVLSLVTSLPDLELNSLMFIKVVKHIFLTLFYVSLSKERDFKIMLINVFFAVSSVFISINMSNSVGLFFLILYRFLLVSYCYNKLNFKSVNLKIVFAVIGIFLFITVFIMSLYYNSPSFYTIVLLAPLLVSALVISFLNLLKNPKNGSSTFFIAISLIFISDALFGLELLDKNKYYFLIAQSILYSLMYLLINVSAIQSERKS